MLRLLTALLLSITGLTGCSSAYQQIPSENHGHRVKSLVLHFTTVDYAQSLEALTAQEGLSAHYLVTRHGDSSAPHDDARIIQLVDEADRAWHAGESYWQHRSRLNDQSIGIEIVYSPHCGTVSQPSYEKQACIFPDYDPRQISQLITLIKDILARNPDIDPTAIVGHSDIAFNRKMDPGPRFPWQRLYQAGIGAWYNEVQMSALWARFIQAPLPLWLLQQALYEYGYNLSATGQLDETTRNALAAFQMHFLPWQVSATADAQTAAAVMALLQKYRPEKFAQIMQRYAQNQTLSATGDALPAGLIVTTVSQPDYFLLHRWQADPQLTLTARQAGPVSLMENQQKIFSQQLAAGQTIEVPLSLHLPTTLLTVSTSTPVHLQLGYRTVTPVDTPAMASPLTVFQGKYNASAPAPVPPALRNTVALLHALSKTTFDLHTPVTRLLPYFRGNGRERCTIGEVLNQLCSGYGDAPIRTTEGAAGTVNYSAALWQQVVPDLAPERVMTPRQAPVTALMAQLVLALSQQQPAALLSASYGDTPVSLAVLLQTLLNEGGYGAQQIYSPTLARQLVQFAPVPRRVSRLAGPGSVWLGQQSGGVLIDPQNELAVWLANDTGSDALDNVYRQKIYRN